MNPKSTRTLAQPPVFEEELLLEWIRNALADKRYPIEITIKINKDATYAIKQKVDGRKVRAEFLSVLTRQFTSRTGIAPSEKSGTKAFTKLWATPMEAMLRQTVYRGTNRIYDDMDGVERYSRLHVVAFNYLVRDAWAKTQENDLTIANPLALQKTGVSVALSGSHYRAAQQYMVRLESNGQ